MFIAFVSDKLRHRYAFTLIPMLIAIAGYAMLLNINGEHHTQYGALFLVTSGCYSAMPVIVCWFTMNLGGHRRRSIGTAWQIGFGNSEHSSFSCLLPCTMVTDMKPVGGIISTYSFLEKDAPLYRPGYIISLSFLCFSAALCIAYLVSIWYENGKRARALGDGTATVPTEEEKERLGDLAPDYRYLY